MRLLLIIYYKPKQLLTNAKFLKRTIPMQRIISNGLWSYLCAVGWYD